MCLDDDKIGRMGFWTPQTDENRAVGWLRKGCSSLGCGAVVRFPRIWMSSGECITPHKDDDFSLTHSHRIHLSIITNDEVWFTVGSETIHMREGELYEINNRRMHSVTMPDLRTVCS